MRSGRHAPQSVVRTLAEPENGGRSRARGLNALQWLGLVAGSSAANHDELACQSLTSDQYVDDSATWIA